MSKSYSAKTLVSNWAEARLEDKNTKDFSGLMLPTPYAHSFQTSYQADFSQPASSKLEAGKKGGR
jgi:Protein of unknown function (DUF1143)